MGLWLCCFLAVDVHLLREINLDKVRSWKSFYRSKQTRGLGLHLPPEKKPEDQKQTTYSRLTSMEGAKVGFEVYAEGTTRVLRICEFSGSHKVNTGFRSSRKLRLRISYFSLHLLEYGKQVRLIFTIRPFQYSFLLCIYPSLKYHDWPQPNWIISNSRYQLYYELQLIIRSLNFYLCILKPFFNLFHTSWMF